MCFVKNIVYKSTRNTLGLYVILHKLKNRIAIPPCPDCVGAARPAYPEVPGGSGQREAHPLPPLAGQVCQRRLPSRSSPIRGETLNQGSGSGSAWITRIHFFFLDPDPGGKN